MASDKNNKPSDPFDLKKLNDKLKNISRQKDIYVIWRKYLKRSDLYKEGCKWASMLKYNPANKFSDEYLKWSNGVKAREVIPEFTYQVINQFKIDDTDPARKEKVLLMLISYYVFFGDVFTEKFGEFWRRAKAILFELSLFDGLKFQSTSAVLPLTCNTLTDILKGISSDFEFREDREPDFAEIMEIMIEMDSQPDIITVQVALDRSLADLVRDFKQIVNAEKKQRSIALKKSFYGYCLPSLKTNFELEAHRRYLRIYDMKEIDDLKWVEIIKKDFPELDIDVHEDWDNLLRVYKADLAKARKILRNVENGIFPGKIN